MAENKEKERYKALSKINLLNRGNEIYNVGEWGGGVIPTPQIWGRGKMFPVPIWDLEVIRS